MPNLKQDILQRLRDFPPAITDNKGFEDLLDDLAEDIQADVIKHLVQCPNPEALVKLDNWRGMLDDAGILWRKDEEAAEIDFRAKQMANDVLGATLHNVLFISGFPIGPRLVQRMLKPLALQQLANQDQRTTSL